MMDTAREGVTGMAYTAWRLTPYGAGVVPENVPRRCSMCETRDGVCQHNTFTRAQAGDHRVATSRPLHREATR